VGKNFPLQYDGRFKDVDAADADQDGTLTVEEISRLGP